MTTRTRPMCLLLALAVALAVVAGRARAQEVKGPQANLLKQVAFAQNLDAQLPLDTPLRDESGRDVRLGDYFGKRPVIVTFVYYECPMLCKLELADLVRNLKALTMSAGNEFEIVTVSIDPTETPAQARSKKAGYLKRYGRAGAEAGWHFLTGDEAAVRRLTGAAGFRYAYDPVSKQYAHAAGLLIATPRGRIARYLFGLDFPASALRWALIEASAGKIGSPVDKLLLMCFHYDPATGRYSFAIMSVVRLLGVATVLGLGTFMVVMFRRDRRPVGVAPALGGSQGAA